MLRVLTLNTWNLSGPWRSRRNEIVEWLRRLAPDIVCLQEVVDDGSRSTAAWLADAARYSAVAFGGAPMSGFGGAEGTQFGNAVLSRWPIDESTSHRLPHDDDPTDIQRVLLHVRTGGHDVFTTHLAWRFQVAALREQQVVAIDEIVAAAADPAAALPPVLAGDFNADPESTEIRFLSGLASIGGHSTYWQDAWRVAGGAGVGLTWDNRNPFAAAEHEPDRRIDYVFVGWRRDGGAGRVESCRVVCDRALTGTFASDHFGVVADIAD